MDSAALPSLSNLYEGIDQWVELAPLLPVLITLEIVLSADNAIALAAITRKLKNVDLQSRSLNIGIAIALVFRIVLILLASLVIDFWPIQLLAGLYLLWLFVQKLIENSQNLKSNKTESNSNSTFLLTVVTIAFTDLAFSLDSVATAVAISDQVLLVITGGIIGVVALRFTAGLFIKWLEEFPRLEIAGYIAVGLVGIKLIISLIIKDLYLSEWYILSIVFILFIWGFSKRQDSTNINNF
tara:strand:- start:580 stop:1299 length:720 start_codon:yes stop_codon:yes gene_type:complete